MNQLLVTADAHLGEPLDLFSTRLPKRLRDRSIRAEVVGDGYWDVQTPTGIRFTLSRTRHADGSPMEEVLGTGSAERTLRDLAADGIWGAVLFPNLTLEAAFIADHEIAMAHAKVYNDFAVESHGAERDRCALIAAIPLTDVDDAVAETERAASLGFAGILVPVMPPRPYSTNVYERVWAAAEANGLTVTTHVATGYPTDDAGNPLSASTVSEVHTKTQDELRAFMGTTNTADTGSRDPHAVRLIEQERASDAAKQMIMSLVGSGVCERFPSLHFSFIEFNANWLVSLMGAMDKAYTLGIGQDPEAEIGLWDHSRSGDDQPIMSSLAYLGGNTGWPYPLRPSEYVRRQMHVSFMDDPVAVAARAITGVDVLMWGNDFPHAEGTFPRSTEAIDQLFRDVADEDRAAMLGGTASRVFGIKVPEHVPAR